MFQLLRRRRFSTPAPITRTVTGFLALFLGSLPCPADTPQSGPGSLTGIVAFAAKGEVLERARITIEGTALATLTDSLGSYTFPALPAGAARVRVFYTGLAPETATVVITAGQLPGLTRQDVDHIAVSDHFEPQQIWGIDRHDDSGRLLSDHDAVLAYVRRAR